MGNMWIHFILFSGNTSNLFLYSHLGGVDETDVQKPFILEIVLVIHTNKWKKSIYFPLFENQAKVLALLAWLTRVALTNINNCMGLKSHMPFTCVSLCKIRTMKISILTITDLSDEKILLSFTTLDLSLGAWRVIPDLLKSFCGTKNYNESTAYSVEHRSTEGSFPLQQLQL